MDQVRPTPITDENTALAKAGHYCAYQERSQAEVRQKLYEWGLSAAMVESVIAELIQSNYLNEERFAYAYAQGKFNQKGWGKNKIKQGLKLKNVPDVLIRKALNSISADDYLNVLEAILQKKQALLREQDPYIRRCKLQQYALSRGYENDIISDVLKNSDL